MDNDSKDLALPVATFVLQTLAVIFNLPAAAVTSTAAAIAAEQYRQRRDQRRMNRLERVLKGVQNRVSELESASADEESIDLFIEVCDKAIQDDEADKEVFYSAILEWMIREKPLRSQVRALSDGVKGLSAVELAFFIYEMDERGSRYAKDVIQNELEPRVARKRRAAFGFSEDEGVLYYGSPSNLGLVLKKYVQVSELANFLKQ